MTKEIHVEFSVCEYELDDKGDVVERKTIAGAGGHVVDRSLVEDKTKLDKLRAYLHSVADEIHSNILQHVLLGNTIFDHIAQNSTLVTPGLMHKLANKVERNEMKATIKSRTDLITGYRQLLFTITELPEKDPTNNEN